MGNVQTSTGVACAIFPTSSSACIIFFIRAATGFFFGGMVPVFLKRDGQLDCWRRTEWSAQARVETQILSPGNVRKLGASISAGKSVL